MEKTDMTPDQATEHAFDADDLLAEAAGLAPDFPSPAFLARLMEDAARLQPPLPQAFQPRSVVQVPQTRPPGRGGMLDALADVFGGRGALAAMMLATVTGLYLGVAQPSVITNLTGLYAESPLDSLDLMSGSDSLLKETTP
jgi:hypothetical protein